MAPSPTQGFERRKARRGIVGTAYFSRLAVFDLRGLSFAVWAAASRWEACLRSSTKNTTSRRSPPSSYAATKPSSLSGSLSLPRWRSRVPSLMGHGAQEVVRLGSSALGTSRPGIVPRHRDLPDRVLLELGGERSLFSLRHLGLLLRMIALNGVSTNSGQVYTSAADAIDAKAARTERLGAHYLTERAVVLTAREMRKQNAMGRSYLYGPPDAR